jgi:hypothetical protein
MMPKRVDIRIGPPRRATAGGCRQRLARKYPGRVLANDVRDRIDALQHEPRSWLYAAERQKRAADLVGSAFQAEAQTWLKLALFSPEDDPELQRRAFELGPSAMMLIGYAIEVVAKGLIVAQGATPEIVSRMTRRHLDANLLSEANVNLTAGEPFLVEKLYHWIRWSGRYPAPKPADGEQFITSARCGGPLTDPGGISTDDYRQACELYDRMHATLLAVTHAS